MRDEKGQRVGELLSRCCLGVPVALIPCGHGVTEYEKIDRR
jgi:hypothetical protein